MPPAFTLNTSTEPRIEILVKSVKVGHQQSAKHCSGVNQTDSAQSAHSVLFHIGIVIDKDFDVATAEHLSGQATAGFKPLTVALH